MIENLELRFDPRHPGRRPGNPGYYWTCDFVGFSDRGGEMGIEAKNMLIPAGNLRNPGVKTVLTCDDLRMSEEELQVAAEAVRRFREKRPQTSAEDK